MLFFLLWLFIMWGWSVLGSSPLCIAGVHSTKCWCKMGQPQASTTTAGGHSPPAPLAGFQRQESQGEDPFDTKEGG